MFQASATAAEVAQRGQGHVLFHRHAQYQAIALTVFGDVDDTVRQAILRRTGNNLMAIKRNVSAGARAGTIQHLHQLGTPGAHQPGHAEDFALAQRKGDIIYARAAQVINLETNITRLLINAWVLIFQLTSHHHLNQRVFGQRHHFTLGNKLPVAEYRHVVADLEDLFHTVGDIDNAAPLGFQLADHAEQGVGFGISEGVSRLIHHDNPGFKAQNFRDLHHLLIANGKFAHQPIAFEAQVQLRQQFVGFGIHLFPVDFAKAVNELTAKEDVLRNGELRDQV